MADHRARTKHVKEEVLDVFEFVEVPQDVHQLCTACLCATRTTHALSEGALKQYYMHILTEMQIFDASVVSLKFCWECVSVLKRAVRFREQVKESYNILHSATLMSNKEDLNELLLKYSSNPGRFNICYNHSINIGPTVQPPAKMVTIKNEMPTMAEYDNDGDEDVDGVKDTDDDDDDDEPVTLVEARAGTSSDVSGSKPVQKGAEQNTGKNVKVVQQNVKKNLISRNDSYKCLVCLKTFTRGKAFFGHMRLHTGEKPHSCGVCQKAFARQQNLITHMKSHSGVESFTMQGGLMKVVRADTGETSLQREVCPTSNKQLMKHKISTPAMKKVIKCEICSKVYKVNKTLKEHMRTHTGERPYKCEVCPKSFTTTTCLRQHRITHAKVKPYKCGHCPRAFAQKKNIINHMQRLHTFKENLECNACKQTFTQKADLLEHTKTHKGQRAYQCQLCPKAYKKYFDWKEHQRSHTGEKPFLCDFCPQGFYTKSQLHQHRRIHTGEKPFQCEVCLISFAQNSGLYQHRRTHTGERPFKCDECGQAFSLKPQLKAHLKKHTHT